MPVTAWWKGAGDRGSVARTARAFIRSLRSTRSCHRGFRRRAERWPRGHTACAKTPPANDVCHSTALQAALRKMSLCKALPVSRQPLVWWLSSEGSWWVRIPAVRAWGTGGGCCAWRGMGCAVPTGCRGPRGGAAEHGCKSRVTQFPMESRIKGNHSN